jgi:hypothetical protein
MPEIAAQSLLKTNTVEIRDVYCQGRQVHQSDEECTSATVLVFPYRGVFVRHLGRDQAVAEANQVLFFNTSEGYRVSHPVPGGDASLSLVVGNDSGGGIAQIFAASHPERVRSLSLTDCDAHDNWPPDAFKPFLAMAASGGLSGTLNAMLADKNVYRSPEALGPAYEHPERVTDESIDIYLRPLVKTEQRTRDFQRFLAAFDNQHTQVIQARLKTLKTPTLIVWGTDDVYFDVKWSRWLADTIPGTRRRVEFEGARIFFPEERWTAFNQELRAHWQAAVVERGNL